ncbi:hypothetical protein C2845_PM06G09880 [Panicum miliaceum]|uniref:Uncharacterized protein n=1 Tax=Panicum miliaceum TaxID=4540 RepID=A0A3L6RBQ5_PANMI|nr:hypothetical protein C2845_PM06G09880 [Panicum miliaceum]
MWMDIFIVVETSDSRTGPSMFSSRPGRRHRPCMHATTDNTRRDTRTSRIPTKLCSAGRAGLAFYLAAAAQVAVVGRGGGGLQPQLLVELADEVVGLGVHALVAAPVLRHGGERRVGDAQRPDPRGAATQDPRHHGRRRRGGHPSGRRHGRRAPAGLHLGAQHLERPRHGRRVQAAVLAARAAPAALEGEEPVVLRVRRRGGAAELHLPGVAVERCQRGGRRAGRTVGGEVAVAVARRVGEEAAQRPAGELAAAEEEVDVHHDALAGEAAAQHVAHGEHHVPQPPRQPGLHGPPRRRRREIHLGKGKQIEF